MSRRRETVVTHKHRIRRSIRFAPPPRRPPIPHTSTRSLFNGSKVTAMALWAIVVVRSSPHRSDLICRFPMASSQFFVNKSTAAASQPTTTAAAVGPHGSPPPMFHMSPIHNGAVDATGPPPGSGVLERLLQLLRSSATASSFQLSAAATRSGFGSSKQLNSAAFGPGNKLGASSPPGGAHGGHADSTNSLMTLLTTSVQALLENAVTQTAEHQRALDDLRVTKAWSQQVEHRLSFTDAKVEQAQRDMKELHHKLQLLWDSSRPSGGDARIGSVGGPNSTSSSARPNGGGGDANMAAAQMVFHHTVETQHMLRRQADIPSYGAGSAAAAATVNSSTQGNALAFMANRVDETVSMIGEAMNRLDASDEALRGLFALNRQLQEQFGKITADHSQMEQLLLGLETRVNVHSDSMRKMNDAELQCNTALQREVDSLKRKAVDLTQRAQHAEDAMKAQQMQIGTLDSMKATLNDCKAVVARQLDDAMALAPSGFSHRGLSGSGSGGPLSSTGTLGKRFADLETTLHALYFTLDLDANAAIDLLRDAAAGGEASRAIQKAQDRKVKLAHQCLPFKTLLLGLQAVNQSTGTHEQVIQKMDGAIAELYQATSGILPLRRTYLAGSQAPTMLTGRTPAVPSSSTGQLPSSSDAMLMASPMPIGQTQRSAEGADVSRLTHTPAGFAPAAASPTNSQRGTGRSPAGGNVQLGLELRDHAQGDISGCLVARSFEGLPAHSSGVRTGDIITMLNGCVVKSRADFFSALRLAVIAASKKSQTATASSHGSSSMPIHLTTPMHELEQEYSGGGHPAEEHHRETLPRNAVRIPLMVVRGKSLLEVTVVAPLQ